MTGQLADEDNIADFWTPLKPAVNAFFEAQEYGVLIANDRSYGVITKNGAFFIFDSLPRDDQGNPTDVDGKACLGKAKTVDELVSLIPKTAGFASGDFSIEAIA